MKTPQWQVLSSACALGLWLTAAAQPVTPVPDQPPSPAADTNAVTQPEVLPAAPAGQTSDIEELVRNAVRARLEAQPGAPAASSDDVEALVRRAMAALQAANSAPAAPAAASEAVQPPSEAVQPLPSARPAMPASREGRVGRTRQGPGTNLAVLTAEGMMPANSANATGGGIAAMNFQNAPLSQVTDFLADAAGFTISSKVPLSGRITLITKRPLSQQAVVKQLNDALADHGYAAFLQDDGTLKIDTAENIKALYGLIARSANYEDIPNTDDLITQILPIKNVDAAQLIQTLQPLLPQGMTLQPSAGANAIVVQDTSAHIRRMAEIISKLDSPLAASATVRVYMLTNADAKSIATVIQSLFQPQGGRGGIGVATFGGFNPLQFMARGGRGGRGGGGGADNNNGRISSPQVVAAAEDRANALVVSGTEEQLAIVDKVIAELDINVDDITMVQVFKLNYADPQDTANELAQLFPNTTTTSQPQGGGGRGGFFFRGGGANAATAPSGRMLKQSQVTAVPDYRTSSIIVVASKTLMPQIADMIEHLDSDRSGEQKVYTFSAEGMDPAVVQQLLQSLIPSASGTGARTMTGQGNSLLNRSTTTGYGTQNRGAGLGGMGGGGYGAGRGVGAGGGFGG